jgi:hypothetical protein
MSQRGMKDIAENTISLRIAYDLIKKERWARVRLGEDLGYGPDLQVPVGLGNFLDFSCCLRPLEKNTQVQGCINLLTFLIQASGHFSRPP